MHDGFAMIRWRAAGIAPGTAGLLWSEAVAAEVASRSHRPVMIVHDGAGDEAAL